MTSKAKSFLGLHWSEPCISLGITRAASAGMPSMVLQSQHLPLQGACGHCQPGATLAQGLPYGRGCQLLPGVCGEVTDWWKTHLSCSTARFQKQLLPRLVTV